ncbi:MAG: Flp family type IVb pilin [Xanthobacteraceae bacterium]
MRKKPPKSNLRATVALLRRRLADDEQGATAIEYALVAAGIGVAIAATVTTLGSATANLFASVAALF